MKDISREHIVAARRQLVEMGLIEPTGKMRNGQVVYAYTEKGRIEWMRSTLMDLCAAGTICRMATYTGVQFPTDQMPAYSEETRDCLGRLCDEGAIEFGVLVDDAGGTQGGFSITDKGFALLPRSEQERLGDARLIILPPDDQPVREMTPEEMAEEALQELVQEGKLVVCGYEAGKPLYRRVEGVAWPDDTA